MAPAPNFKRKTVPPGKQRLRTLGRSPTEDSLSELTDCDKAITSANESTELPAADLCRKAESPNHGPSYFLTLVICTGGFALGYAIGFTSPASYQLKAANGTEPQAYGRNLALTGTEISWFGSALFLAAGLGGIVGGLMANRLGRRLTTMITTIPMIAGWVLIVHANQVAMLITGRVLLGWGVGVLLLVNPVYIAETVQLELRGILTTCMQISLTLGVIVCFGLGGSVGYRDMSIVGACLAGVFFLLLWFIPETPRWYMRAGHLEEGIKSLQRMRGSSATVDHEAAQIMKAVTAELNAKPFSMAELKEPCTYQPLMMAIALMFFQQFSGINAVLSYTTIIFQDAGLAEKASAISTGVAGVQLLFTFFSAFIVDRYGRRPLLMVAGVGMGISLTVLALFFFNRDHIHGETAAALPATAIYVYTASFSMGLGIIPWLFMAEAFQTRAFPALSAVTAGSSWFMAFLVTQYFSALSDLMTDGGVFLLMAVVSFALVLFTKVSLIETKGLSLEDVENIFKCKSGLSDEYSQRPSVASSTGSVPDENIVV
ncbi:facilitated trehalose transporter Tret1-like [Sycon ciliatum]|uniref:facilitated trehalose transporter Tret1-like n=1 Tax=Sycon ciliatum TaxID=27933 RepID=UPI0031F67D11